MYHQNVFGCFIWDLFGTFWRCTYETSSLCPFKMSSQHSNKTSWRRTTETSWWRSTETSLGVSFEMNLQRCWDVQKDVVTTLPRRFVAGWVYCSSFSALAAYTFDWVTDGKSLIKIKWNRFINSVCFQVRSITKKEKYGNYSVKVHYEKYSKRYTWKYAMKSTVHGKWMEYRKYGKSFLLPKYRLTYVMILY